MTSRPHFNASLDIFLREGAQFSARHDPGDDVVVLTIGARDAITVFASPAYAARLAEAINVAAMTLRSVSDDEGDDSMSDTAMTREETIAEIRYTLRDEVGKWSAIFLLCWGGGTALRWLWHVLT